jgi:hypothetical protein
MIDINTEFTFYNAPGFVSVSADFTAHTITIKGVGGEITLPRDSAITIATAILGHGLPNHDSWPVALFTDRLRRAAAKS